MKILVLTLLTISISFSQGYSLDDSVEQPLAQRRLLNAIEQNHERLPHLAEHNINLVNQDIVAEYQSVEDTTKRIQRINLETNEDIDDYDCFRKYLFKWKEEEGKTETQIAIDLKVDKSTVSRFIWREIKNFYKMLENFKTYFLDKYNLFKRFQLVNKLAFNLDQDLEDLEKTFNPLNNFSYCKEIYQELMAITSYQRRKIIFEISFQGICGYLDFADLILKEKMPQIIRSLASSLNEIPTDHLKDVMTISKKIFGVDYENINSDNFELKDRLTIFHCFLKSEYRHLFDEINRE